MNIWPNIIQSASECCDPIFPRLVLPLLSPESTVTPRRYAAGESSSHVYQSPENPHIPGQKACATGSDGRRYPYPAVGRSSSVSTHPCCAIHSVAPFYPSDRHTRKKRKTALVLLLLAEVLENTCNKRWIGYNNPTLSRRTKHTMLPCCYTLKFSRFQRTR